MKTRRLLLLFVSMLFSQLLLMAQNSRVITGVVKDNEGKPVPAATVSVKGTTQNVITNEDGQFTISITRTDATIVVSAVGFGSKEIKVGDQSSIDVSLETAASDLSEVVVTGLGIKREARSIGYSAQKINSADISKASAPDLASGLMGKSAGLNISMPNGIQGGSQRIVIRGNNSILGSNQPLIVIDGIQVQNDPVGGTTATAGTSIENPKDWGSFLNFLNTDDIQDITVLKGATAAALYGARGSNGVLLITSKKGIKKPGIGVDYNFSTLFSKAARFQEVQNEYGYGGANAMWSSTPQFPTVGGELRYPGNYPWDGQPVGDAYQAAGSIPGGYSTWDLFSWYGPAASWGHKLDGTEIVWWDGVKRKWDPQPDNRKTFFRTGNTTTHNLSFSGGGDFGTIRVGLTRLDNTAVLPNSHYNQNTANLGANLNISKKLKAEVTASYTNYNRKNTPDIGSENSWAKFMIHGMSRDYKPLEFDMYKNADGSKNIFDQTTPFRFYPYNNNSFKDLFWNLYEHNQELTRNQLLGSLKLSADLTPWLNVTGRASMNYATTDIESKYTPIDAGGVRGQYGLENTKNQNFNFELFTTLHKENIVKDVNASLLIGNAALRNRMHNLSAWNNGETTPFTLPYKYFLANTTGTLPAAKELWGDYDLNSLFGVLDLSYKNYLFLQVSGRNDWSSTLPVKTASYFFPSGSLSFVFTEAIKGMQDINWLSYGKLKVSAAQSANGALPYQTNYTYSSYVISNYLNTEEINSPTSFGGVPVRRVEKILPPADLLVPQRNRSYEVGLELGFLNNRINTEITYYQTKATSQIMSGSLALSSGAQSITFNSGALSNRGVEFIVRATPVQKTNLRWDVTLNAAHNKNKVLSLSEGIDRYPLQDLWAGNGVQMYVEVGQDYGSIYGYDYTYKNGQRVVEKILDKNDPTKVVGTRYVTTTDPIVIGNATPKLTGGLGNTLRYKNFSLYVLTDFKLGGDIYSADYAAAMGMGLSPSTLNERDGNGLPYTYPDGTKANHGVIIDGVFADGTRNTDVVHYMYKYAGAFQGWSNVKMPRSNAVFENTWVKMREVALTYSIPSNLVKKLKFVQGLDLSLIGRNLFYIYTSLPEKLNPEAINGIGNAQGIQWAQFPMMRDMGISLKVRL